MTALISAMDGEKGDLLFFAADKKKLVYDILGALRVKLAEMMGLLDKEQFEFVWITEFPLLEWSEEENRFVAMHHPFTMPMEEDLQYIDSDPGRVRAKAYDIVLNGTELGGGSVRIFQNDIQEKMFEALGFTKEKAYEQFANLFECINHGYKFNALVGNDISNIYMSVSNSIKEYGYTGLFVIFDEFGVFLENKTPDFAVKLIII